ncbi:nicotinate-nucleotide adenylyltransferase [Roseivivax sp. CAU 1761]
MVARLPLAPGLRVGLFGGSFDPPHAGHVHVTREALKRFGLDRVVWLVSPGNPLKRRGPAPLAARLDAARRLMRHPRVIVSDIEAALGTRYTAATLAALTARHPGTRFVWLMGADNLAQFHRWEDWQGIAATLPLGVLARPGERLGALTSVAAHRLAAARLPAAAAPCLPFRAAPAWCFLNVPLRAVSSTAIRAGGAWPET